MRLQHQPNRSILRCRAVTFRRIAATTGRYDIVGCIATIFSNWYKMVLAKSYRMLSTVCTLILVGCFDCFPLFPSQCVSKPLKLRSSPPIIYHALESNLLRIFKIPFCPPGFGFIFIPRTVFTLLLSKIILMALVIFLFPFLAFGCFISYLLHLCIAWAKTLPMFTFMRCMAFRMHFIPSEHVAYFAKTMSIMRFIRFTIGTNYYSHKVIIP